MYTHKIIAKKIRKRINKKVERLHERLRAEQEHEVKRWYDDGGEVNLKHDFKLTKKSVVFDVGGYIGEWAEEISKRYGSKLYVFEPVTKYAATISSRLKKSPNVKVYRAGLGGENRTDAISIDELASSVFIETNNKEKIEITDIVDFCKDNKIRKIDLIKMNIEGGEYELLERMITSGLIHKTTTLLIQFHNFVPNGELRMENIQKKLSKTHRQRFQYLFVWERWDLK